MKEYNDKEVDMLQFIDNAVLAAGVYGYGTINHEEKQKVNDANDLIESFLVDKLSREDYMQLEDKMNVLIGTVEHAGFKRGFHIAMKIMMDVSKLESNRTT